MPENLIHLQSIGKVPAKPVSEFQVGDWMGWNFGYASEIKGIERRGKFAVITFGDGSDNISRRMKLDRLAAVADATWPQWGK